MASNLHKLGILLVSMALLEGCYQGDAISQVDKIDDAMIHERLLQPGPYGYKEIEYALDAFVDVKVLDVRKSITHPIYQPMPFSADGETLILPEGEFPTTMLRSGSVVINKVDCTDFEFENKERLGLPKIPGIERYCSYKHRPAGSQLFVPLELPFGKREDGRLFEKKGNTDIGTMLITVERNRIDCKDIDTNTGYAKDLSALHLCKYSISIPTPVKTDVRGRVFLPEGAGPFPVVFMLHGEHKTCGYHDKNGVRVDSGTLFTITGNCPPGQVEAPSYRGYDYLGRQLASHGIAVASINANRGVNFGPVKAEDRSYILTRGRLLLKHLYKFQKWNREEDSPYPVLLGKLDFDHVGFMGHSRGGEGVRAAWWLYNQQDEASYAPQVEPFSLKALLEVAPVDGYTDYELNSEGVPWAVMLATCDGDVSSLDGLGVLQRRQVKQPGLFSATFAIAGGNHNSFNSEWLRDEGYCPYGGEKISRDGQENISAMVHTAFFKAFVLPEPKLELLRLFDPQYVLPQDLSGMATIIRYSNMGASSSAVTLGEFQVASGDGVDINRNIYIKEERYQGIRLTGIATTDHGVNSVLLPLSHPPEIGDWLLLLKSARLSDQLKLPEVALPVDFGIQLVLADGSVTEAVRATDYVNLDRVERKGSQRHVPFAGIPLAFQDFNLKPDQITMIRGVKLLFDREFNYTLIFDRLATYRKATVQELFEDNVDGASF